MNVTKETITPKKAMEWLKRNVNNRPFRKGYSERIAADIAAKRYELNGETIKFNGNGDLVDGQHRLHAVIIAGLPIETYVVRGVPHEAFDTIDTGTPRVTSDALARSGEQNYRQLACALRIAWQISSGKNGDTGSIKNHEAMEFLAANPELRNSVSLCRSNEVRALMSDGVAAGLHYLMSRKDAAKSDEFWRAVASGEGLKKTMPAYELRQRLIENRGSKAKLKRFYVVALAIKAWNAFRANKAVKFLRWSEDEAFPTIE